MGGNSTMIVKIKGCLTRTAVRGAQRGVAQRGAADAQHPRGSGGQLAPGGVRGNAPLTRGFWRAPSVAMPRGLLILFVS